jgi:Tol biopolymer transport system component
MRPLVALLVALSALLASAGDAARPRLPGKIVFASERGSTLENSELYSIGVDGSRRRALTRNQGRADRGRWSPDGRLLAYVSERLQRGRQLLRSLYLMRPDGGQRRLTSPNLVVDEFDVPNWSPDGGKLAFAASRGSRRGIWTIGKDGRGLRLVARDGAAPAWSTRGDRIAFVRFGRIFTVRAAGGAVRRLTRGPYDGSPAWSPDGRRIAFVRSDANGMSQAVQVLSAKGGPLRRILGSAEDISELQWSPDGRRLLFTATSFVSVARIRDRAVTRLRRGEWPTWSPDGRRIAFTWLSGLYVMNPNGKSVRRVRSERGLEFWGGPAWSPDGKTLVYSLTLLKSDLEIYVIDADGSRLRQLTHNSVGDWGPAWSPTRRRIAFVRRGAIWLIGADGSGARRLVAGTEPSWSPQGSQLVYTRGGSVFIVGLGGGAPIRLVEGHSPAWSPRGGEIAFVRGLRLLAIDPRSKAERTIADDASACPGSTYEASLYGPDWSPDGTRLVYAIACDDGRFTSVSAVVVRADGGDSRNLELDNLVDSRLAWSPDGLRVAFASEDNLRRIGTARLDGTGRTTVVADPAGAAYLDPDW